MAIFYTYDLTTPIPVENVRLFGAQPDSSQGWTSSANAGGSDTAFITLFDPSGVLDISPMKYWYVDEADASPSRIWTGYIVSARIRRGTNQLLAGRVWDIDLAGVNSYPMLRVFDPAVDEPKRPAETNIERIDWLVGTTPVIGGGVLFDDAYVDTASPQDFDEADYDGQHPADVLSDLVGPIERNWFIVYNPTNGRPSLFYGAIDAGFSDSSLRFSNVAADYDGVTTFEVSDDSEMSRDGTEIYAAVHVKWRGGSFLRRRPSTATPYVDRHANLSSDRIGRFATASSWAETFLDAHDAPREMLTWTSEVPRATVNAAREGQRVQVKFSHFPGFESFTWVVIRRRTVTPRSDDPTFYTIRYEGSIAGVDGGVGGGDPNEFPQEPVCDPDAIVLIQAVSAVPTNDTGTDSHIVLDTTPTPGNLQVVITVTGPPHGASPGEIPTGYTEIVVDNQPTTPQNWLWAVYWRIAQEGDTTTLAFTYTGTSHRRSTYLEYSGVDTLDSFDTVNVVANNDNPIFAGSGLTPTAGADVLLVGAVVPSLNVTDTFSAVATGGETEDIEYGLSGASPYIWGGHIVEENVSGSYSMSVTSTHGGIQRGNLGVLLAFTCSGDATACPTSGKWALNVVPTPVADGVTTTFTLPCPFADGSLVVHFDTVDQTSAIASYDGAAGTFTMTGAPIVGQQVFCDYQGR